MREDIRKARVEKYGSFLFCPDRNVLCFGMYNEYGICSRTPCCLDDPEYVTKKEQIAENVRHNYMARQIAREEAQKEKVLPKAKDERWATLERIKELEKLIAIKENTARKHYRMGRTRIGDNLMHEAAILRRKVRELKRRI